MPTRHSAVVLKRSAIHGRGVFAAKRIRAGTVVIEYTGELVDSAEATRRYAETPEIGHTMLFELNDSKMIDATRRGSIARYINHSCAGNCRPVLDGDRIFIEATKNIQPGAELTYDYKLQRSGRLSRAVRALYTCRCGASVCRGTLLETHAGS